MQEKTRAFERLVRIVHELREQCPWDMKQTNESLRQLTIEETYELADAILKDDQQEIKEELGDIMMHMVFYSIIGEEKKEFDITSVLDGISDKLIKRHPHIYGDPGKDGLREVHDEDDVKKNWERLKLREGKESVLSGVPVSLPAMIKALRITEKASQVGFDWDNKEQVWEKLEEEIQEFRDETETGSPDIKRIEEEFGDILFALVNYARFKAIDPELALERTNQKFISRFQYIEKKARENNRKMEEMTLDEMESLWQESKKRD